MAALQLRDDGPGTKLPSLDHIEYDELVESYREQTRGLIEGGIDVLKVETCQDLLQTKAALGAIEDVFTEMDTRLPVIASVTIETTGTMLLGSDIACALTTLEALDTVDVIGINCATGPEQMVEHVRHLAQNSRRPVFIGPNAGCRRFETGRRATALARGVRALPAHLRGGAWHEHRGGLLRDDAGTLRGGDRGRRAATAKGTAGDARGSVQFPLYERALRAGHVVPGGGGADERDGVTGVPRPAAGGGRGWGGGVGARAGGGGAHVLDLMVDYVGRQGAPDMERYARELRTQATLPLVFDSTEIPVIETALKLYGGKGIVNSINLEDGSGRSRGCCR